VRRTAPVTARPEITMSPTVSSPVTHRIASREEWLAARRELLQHEKELTRRRDAISAMRRELPWVRVDKPYRFDTPQGVRSLADLFAGRSQLVVKHFMLAPGWQEGCVGCSFEADHAEAALVHLENHDVSYVAVSRAPLAEIEAFRRRMGWRFPWVSSHDSDFNFDYHVSFTPEQIASGRVFYNFREDAIPIGELSGHSVFCTDADGGVFHTYSAYGRGAEELLGTYMFLDMTPKGRNETGRGNLTDWVRHHDRYAADGHVDETGRFVAGAAAGATCCGGKQP
jgi:predicted dithiol-disulfide oxidoreductase (DUF899 family)